MTRYVTTTKYRGRNRVPIDDAVTEIDGAASGGSISVTDGTTTVDPATSLRLPAGTLSDLGGGEGGFGLIFTSLSVDFAFDTPGLNAPSDNGAELLAVPAGSYVLVNLLAGTLFNQAGTLIAVLAKSTAASGAALGWWDGAGSAGGTADVQGSFTVASLAQMPRLALAITDSKVCLSFNPDGDNPTSGTGTLVAIIATPAA